jgi:hypothetical protein
MTFSIFPACERVNIEEPGLFQSAAYHLYIMSMDKTQYSGKQTPVFVDLGYRKASRSRTRDVIDQRRRVSSRFCFRGSIFGLCPLILVTLWFLLSDRKETGHHVLAMICQLCASGSSELTFPSIFFCSIGRTLTLSLSQNQRAHTSADECTFALIFQRHEWVVQRLVKSHSSLQALVKPLQGHDVETPCLCTLVLCASGVGYDEVSDFSGKISMIVSAIGLNLFDHMLSFVDCETEHLEEQQSGGTIIRTIFETCDTNIQIVEDWQAMFMNKCIHINVFAVEEQFAHSMDPVGFQDPNVWSLFGGMLAFWCVDITHDQMSHVDSQIKAMNSSHRFRELGQPVLMVADASVPSLRFGIGGFYTRRSSDNEVLQRTTSLSK